MRRHRAYRSNLLRRDLSDGTKREVVKEYLLEHPERLESEAYDDIASDLGVHRDTVRRAESDLKDAGKLAQVREFTTSEKREMVQSYCDQHPDASNRKVAREVDCDVTHVTVGNWRSEWREGDECEDESTGLDIMTNSVADAEMASEVAKQAKEGDETAQKETQRLSNNETSLNKAHRRVKKEQNKRERQEKRDDLKDTSGNSSGSYENESREKAAEKINADVSGRTLEKGLGVKESRGYVFNT